MLNINFNRGWKFSLDNPLGAHLNDFEDALWREVELPHDWSIEFPFDKEEGEACTGYLLGGIAWYRKHFLTNDKMKDKEVFICFDGVYNNATVYCNGKYIEFHPYGYSPFNYNITSYLNPSGEDNVIAVYVDRTRYADSRWYTGSGIYRDVKLAVMNKVHIPIWGTFINTTEVSKESCKIKLETNIENSGNIEKSVTLLTKVFNEEKELVISLHEKVKLQPKEIKCIKQEEVIKNPIIWELDNPSEYKAISEIIEEDILIDSYETKFGVRDFCFDTNRGFFFNGKATLIKGVCLHHEAGLVGAAVPKDVWERRLSKLKECGCNAIRTAHNPASEEFLDLCDKMGFLVQEEFFDEWDNPKDKRLNGEEKSIDYKTRSYVEYFEKWAKADLQNTVLRDRNHPCIFQWSIGNEIEWTYPKYNLATGYFDANADGNYFWTLPPYDLKTIRENISLLREEEHELGKTAKKLSQWTKELDATRPIIANCILPSASYESGYTDALDIVGYSYRQVIYEYGHENYPHKPIMGTENLAQWHEWKHVLEKEYIPGIFLWTGIDYIGEVGNPSHWPCKALATGLLDLAGFEKHSYYMFKALWQEEPTMHIATQTLDKSLYKFDYKNKIVEKEKDGWKKRLWIWHDMNYHWNYREKEDIVIELYSNCEEITLYLNGESLGEKRLEEFGDHIYKWCIPYTNGELKAVGKYKGKEIEKKIISAKKASKFMISSDKDTLNIEENEVAHIVIQVVDDVDNPVMHEEIKCKFNVDDSLKILGVDNGDAYSVQTYQNDEVETKNGRTLLIVKGVKAGVANITVEGFDLDENGINLLCCNGYH